MLVLLALLPSVGRAEWWNGFPPANAPDGRVHSMLALGGSLYCAGQFSNVAGTPAKVAAWNGASWSAVGSLAASSGIEKLAIYGGQLVAVGNAISTGGPTMQVAIFNGATWSQFGGAFAPFNATCAVEHAGSLWVGGSDGQVHRWTGTAWNVMGSYGNVTALPRCLVVHQGTLYVGGDVGVRSWNGSAWQNLGSGLGGAGTAFGMASRGDSLVVVGNFNSAGGAPATRAAAWDGAAWHALGLGFGGSAYDVAETGTGLYACGNFTMAGGAPASGVARWNGSEWSAMDAGVGVAGFAVAALGPHLYVGGSFSTAGGMPSPYIARWTQLTDCNGNGIPDALDIANETSPDCDANGVPDECDLANGAPDCNQNGVPDRCEPDCDGDGVPNVCEVFADCNQNGIHDDCDIASGMPDCDDNGVPDTCDPDCDGDGTPDACETIVDCNANLVHDDCDIASGTSLDCDQNGVPDDCQADCDGDGVPDVCESLADCDADGEPNHCEIAAGAPDCDANGVPDGCQSDSDHDGMIDACEILGGAPDCNGNGVPDESDVSPGSYVFTRTFYETVGLERSHQVAGDFDKDGWPDLAYHDFDVTIFWNEAGTGWTAAPFNSGVQTRTHVAGDFNGDGNLDVAMAMGPPSVLYRLGTGTRTWGAYGVKDFDLIPQEYGRSTLPLNADGDGATDLAWIRIGRAAVGVVRGLDLTSANPKPDYLQIPVTTESAIQRIAVRRMAAGGLHDIVVQNDAYGDTASGFFLIRPSGGGDYAAPQHFNSPVPVYALGCGDLNGDGREDVVMEGWSGSQLYLVTWLSNEFGGLNPPDTTHHGNGLPSFDLALADFDRDGRLDVALKRGPVVLGTGDGKFRAPAHSYPTTGDYGWMTVLDYDRDGWPDLADAMTFCNQNGCGSTVLGVHRNDIVPAGASADEDDDGIPDECQVTDVPSPTVTPAITRLVGPLSNPVRSAAAIRFELSRPATVRLGIYDIGGRLVREWKLEDRPAGTHDVRWDGRAVGGGSARGGVYFVRMETAGVRQARKFVFTP